MTDDPTINNWLDSFASYGTKNNLASTPPDVRNKVCVSVYSRSQTTALQNVEAYLNGALNKEKNQLYGPAGGRAGEPPKQFSPYGGRPPPDPITGMAGTGMSRPIATPQQVPQLCPRPLWVLEAWQLHNKPREFMRMVSRYLPGSALAIVAPLPGQLQHMVLVAMLLFDAAHGDPTGFLNKCVEQVRSLPAVISSTPSSQASSECDGDSRRKLVILSFGLTQALEWPAVEVAFQLAKDNLQANFEITARCSFHAQCAWKEVIEEMIVNLAGVPVEFACLEEAVTFVQGRALQWKASGSMVLALLHVPVAQASSTPPTTAAPGYHGSQSGGLWHALAAMRSIQNIFPEICVATFVPPRCSKADLDFFDSCFGKTLDLTETLNWRLPLQPWEVRVLPCPTPIKFASRPLYPEKVSLSDFNPLLHGAFVSEKQLSVELPLLDAVELFCDSDPTSFEAQKLQNSVTLVMRHPRSGGDVVMLPRSHLAAVCGLTEFKVLEFWEKRRPCCKYINSYTGTASQQGFPESAPCGHGRWCPDCSYFYESITSCVHPYVVSSGVFAVLHALSKRGSEAQLFQTRLAPEHTCSAFCAGFAIPA